MSIERCPNCDRTNDTDKTEHCKCAVFEDDVAIAESMFLPVEIEEPQS